jgi:hypothetical protein
VDSDTHPHTIKHTNRLQNRHTNSIGYPQQIRDTHGLADKDQITNTHQNDDADSYRDAYPYDDTHQISDADPYRDANAYAYSDGDSLVCGMKKTLIVLRGDVVAPRFFVPRALRCSPTV